MTAELDDLVDLFSSKYRVRNPDTNRMVTVKVHAIFNYSPIRVKVEYDGILMSWRLTLKDLEKIDGS